MRSSDLQREENYSEYLRLLQDNDYLDVTYDEESGGVSAVHRQHKYAKQEGICGMRQGDYELAVLDVLRNSGYRIVLGAESNNPGIKSCDGYIDDTSMEIKAIEGNGTWAICTKLLQAEKQHAQRVIFYFPDDNMYSTFRIMEGIRLYRSNPDSEQLLDPTKILVVVKNQLVKDWDKKATPIEGWSI